MPRTDGFNDCILASVTTINAERAGQGYDINSYFTHDLPYGPYCCITANHAPRTMCVAAVTEIIVTSLNAWHAQNHDPKPFDKLPLRSWRGGSKRDIRAHIFMYDGLACNGTAHALERFGIGRQVHFSELQSGEFINFNRTSGSGHACVFLAYIDAAGDDVAVFGPSVVGFRYFSAQGKGLADAGFGYRWAFFDGHCPAAMPQGRRRDCGVMRSDDPKLLCCGYLLHPSRWPDSPPPGGAASRELDMRGMRPGAVEPEFETDLTREMPHPDMSRFDGVTTD